MPTVDYLSLLNAEFARETDRAAVIVAASMLDELLQSLLVARLVPVSSSTDELFDGANAPLATFSSRIEMAYRTGLVSVKLARDIHLIRRIRNDFAHNIHGASFEDTRVKQRIAELDNSNGILSRSPVAAARLTSARSHFLEAVAWMIFHLEGLSSTTKSLEAAGEEWGYVYSADPRFQDPPQPTTVEA
jgi:DNA-binding MltR family transcriptional regulator